MRGVTIILVVMLLGLGTARAATESIGRSQVATPAEGIGAPVDAQVSRDPSSETVRDAGVDNGDTNPASQPMTVWDYDVSPQITINLEYRPLVSEENQIAFGDDGVGVEELTKNLLLGLHYKF